MIKYFYSAQTSGFYPTDIFDELDMPADVVEVTEQEYNSLIEAQSEGQVIQPGAGGVPESVGRVASISEVAALKIAEIDNAYATRLSQGFVSDALGTYHIYGGDAATQTDLVATILVGGDRPFPCANLSGELAILVHTNEEIKQVLADGFIVKQNLLIEIATLRGTIGEAIAANDKSAIETMVIDLS